MHASRRGLVCSLVLWVAWLGSQTVSAAPAPQAATTTASDGAAATTTIDPNAATPTGSPGGAYKPCRNTDGPFAPFCAPANASTVEVGDSYYVTWDTSFFGLNETVKIQANYVNASGGGPQAFESGPTTNSWGHISWTIQSEWLKSQPFNNVTLFITAISGKSLTGPTVMITNHVNPGPSPPNPTQPPNGRDLYIALPAVAGFILLCVCGGYIFNRNNRKIGLGNVMSRRNGYGVGKSRRQRLGLAKKNAAIQLRTQELTSDGQYRDVPVEQEARIPPHRRTDSDGLASLVGTPTEERPRGGNVFRDEMRRQEQSRF